MKVLLHTRYVIEIFIVKKILKHGKKIFEKTLVHLILLTAVTLFFFAHTWSVVHPFIIAI